MSFYVIQMIHTDPILLKKLYKILVPQNISSSILAKGQVILGGLDTIIKSP